MSDIGPTGRFRSEDAPLPREHAAATIVGTAAPETPELYEDSWRWLNEELSVSRFFDRMALRIELRHLSPVNPSRVKRHGVV